MLYTLFFGTYYISISKYYQMVFPSYGKVKFGGKYLIKISKESTVPRAILFLWVMYYIMKG